MTLKKLLIILGVAIPLILATMVLVLIPDIRYGITSTITGTFKDSQQIINHTTSNPSNPTNPVDGESTDGEEYIDPTTEEQSPEPPKATFEPTLRVHILDTLGDIIIIEDNGVAMLVNGGLPEDARKVKEYLYEHDLRKFRYVVGTNHHRASVGGLKEIMSYISTDYILMSPNVAKNENSKEFINYLNNVQLMYTSPGTNGTFKVGNTDVRLIATHSGGSLGVVVSKRDTNFLFTGTTTLIEDRMLNLLPESIDVYGITHATNTYELPTTVLDRTSVKEMVINNRIGVDIKGVVNSLSAHELSLYKTTDSGAIVLESDGVTYKVRH